MNITEEQEIKITRILKIASVVLAAVLVLILCGTFVLLVKVKGNFSYVYNYMVKTEGGKSVEKNPNGAAYADSPAPFSLPGTAPFAFLKRTEILENGAKTDVFNRAERIVFTEDYLKDFTAFNGIITFRGNYSRSKSSYGTVSLKSNTISKDYWTYKTGKVLKSDGVNFWSGNGWTGQPLAVQWDQGTKAVMNLYPEAKAKSGLVEVIYPGMDGMIHFLDMETGKETRDAINVGMTFKGTCSLHPYYPLLVCGSGDSAPGLFGEQVSARVFIYSLLDGKKLYEFGANDNFAPRIWHAYDSSAIFSAETDTLIAPGENGVIYTIKLNSVYDPANGILSVDPEQPVEYTYYSEASEKRIYQGEGGYGSEASAVVWENYLFLGDNGGIFYCLDLNTLTPVWVQDLYEDINSSPVFEVTETGEKYIYVGTTLKYHTDGHHLGEACIYKINAMTGDIVWKKPYEVHTVLGLAGGILSTGTSGEGKYSDYIYYAVSKVPSVDTAYIVAISKKTGEEYWRTELKCDAWSSGALLYDTDGSAKYVQCCGNGDILLMDAKTGKILASKNFGSNIEATPVVFDNRLAVGLRSEYILGIKFE
jgi:hypothetical protein